MGVTCRRVPELRFSEFSKEFNMLELDNLIEVSSKKVNPKIINKNYKCIELEHISQGTGELLGYTFSKDQASIKNLFISNQVLFGKLRPYLKKFLQPKFNGVCSSEIWVLNGKEIINDYLFQLVQTSKFNLIANVSSGSKMPRADWKYMSQIPFLYPSKPEQEKIASFLSSVDSRIAQLTKKEKLLREYKKGVMQKIFSQELRFKDDDGSEFPEWVEKKLGEIAIKKSSNISANKIEDNIGTYIIYGASGVLKLVDFYEEKNDYISIVKDGAGVGRILYCKGKSSVLGTMDIIKPKNNLDTYFLYCLLGNIDFVKYVSGSTIPHIYFKDYSKTICNLSSLKEQTKIANFLSSLDTKIEQVTKELNLTKEFKKALLQKMFV